MGVPGVSSFCHPYASSALVSSSPSRSFSPLSAFAAQPNIFWVANEDHGPQMGCYGDTSATTPNLDQFATRALRYTHAWAVAPVCAPTRTTIISGLHGPSSGGDHMRSRVAYPAG